MKNMGVGGIHFAGAPRFEQVYRDALSAIALAAEHAAVLRNNGWAEPESKTLEVETERLQSLRSQLIAKRQSSLEATRKLRSIEKEVDAYRGRLRKALQLAKLQGRVEVDLSIFTWTKAKKGRLQWAIEIRESVVRVDHILRMRMWSGSALADLDVLIGKLQETCVARELVRRPLAQLAIDAISCRRRIRILLRELNLAAQLAFEGNAKMVSAFRFGASEPVEVPQAA